MLAVIPFSGFYHSVHDSALDDAFNQMFSDSSGNTNFDLVERAFNLVDWTMVHVAYAEAYVENFGLHFKLPSLKFESLNSPREYNFTTDRIFVELSTDDVRRVFSEVPRMELRIKAEEMFTSRSGFISYYDPDYSTWGGVEGWDHNQLLCLLTAMADTDDICSSGDDFDGWPQFSLMEDDQCNGHLDRMLEEAMVHKHNDEAQRLWNIADYLRRREDRKWTMRNYDLTTIEPRAGA